MWLNVLLESFHGFKIPFTENFLRLFNESLYFDTQVGPKGCSKEKPFSKNSEKK